jgi:hypothetical protein
MSWAREVLQDLGAPAGVKDQESVTRSQVPAQRSSTRVSIAVDVEAVEPADKVHEEAEEGEGEKRRERRL